MASAQQLEELQGLPPEQSNLDVAADNHAVAATGKSIFSSAGDLITKGLPLTGLSIYNSFKNTAVELGNYLGADWDKNEVAKQLEDRDGDLLQYYKDHEQGIEAAGLIAGSFIPGTVAVKGLKLAMAGRGMANMEVATGLLSPMKTRIIESAKAEIELSATGESLMGSINAAKYKAIGIGFADQALQAAAWEVATVATMKANPMLEDDTYKDVISNVFFGALLGGGIGGAIEGIFTNKLINKAILAGDDARKAQQTLGVDGRLGKGAFIDGDRAVQLVQAMDNLPVGTTTAQTATAKKTLQLAETEVRGILTDMSGGDKGLATDFYGLIKKMRDTGMDREEAYGYLARGKDIRRISEYAHLPERDLFYPTETVGRKGDTFNDLFTNSPTGKSEPYHIPNGADEVKLATAGSAYEKEGQQFKFSNPQEAFREGLDIFVDANQKAHINPKSKNVVKTPAPGMSNLEGTVGAEVYINLETGARVSSVVPRFGDMGAAADMKLAANERGIVLNRQGEQKPLSIYQTVEGGYSFNPEHTTPVEASSRYVWAGLRKIQDKDVINYNDIPMLEQLWRQGDAPEKLAALKEGGVKIRTPEGNLIPISLSRDDIGRQVLNIKDDTIAQLYATNPKIRADEVALRAGVPIDYVESGLKASRPINELIAPLEEHMATRNVRMNYDIANPTESFDVETGINNVLRGEVDVAIRIQYAREQAHSAVYNFFKDDAERVVFKGSASEANIGGAGPKAFASSNAEYGTAAQKMEGIGAVTSDVTKKMIKSQDERLVGHHLALMGDEQQGAELALLTNIMRRTGERYVFLPDDVASKALKQSPSIGMTQADIAAGKKLLVLTKSVKTDAQGNIIDWAHQMIPSTVSETGFVIPKNLTNVPKEGKFTFYQVNDKVANYLGTHTEINDERLIHHNNFLAAQGIQKQVDLGNVYFPPIDTTKFKYVALVRETQGKGNASSSVSAVTAQTSADLQRKITAINEVGDYEIFEKGVSKRYHEALGDYNYNLNLSENRVDDALRRKGVLSDLLPNVRGEDALNDFKSWHDYMATRLVRNHVELGNAQVFSELRAMGQPYSDIITSKVGGQESRFEGKHNPFESYIKTALNISEKSEYRLWQQANETVEALFGTAFRTARETFGQASKGLISFDKANELTQKMGLGQVYGDSMRAYYEANRLPITPALSRFVSTANSVLAATAIRLDAFQSLVNVISTPVMMIAETASLQQKLKLKNLTDLAIPGTEGKTMPGFSKLLFTAVNDFFGADKEKLIDFYKNGTRTVRGDFKEYHGLLDNAAVTGLESESALRKAASTVVDIGSKLTLSNHSEEFVRFVASRVAHQAFEAMGVEGTQLENNIRTFVNRVHGNSIASQRPIAFQGVIGQAVGLFQTYQFNLLQQTFKNLADGNTKAVAMMAGMQTSLFGLQGLPGFQAINTHIIGNASNNPNHNDIYSVLPQLTDKKLGDYLLYGVTSNWLNSGVYTRGDINPRQITILPVNPLDIPAVSSGLRFVTNLVDVFSKVNDGGKLSSAILNGLEHNGLSRPLAGLGQVVQGYSSTAKGSLIAASNDWFSIASASRILGARPLDEAVVMDAMYRKTAYDAKDGARMEQLGEAVKLSLASNQSPSEGQVSQFAAEYAAAGGRLENFNRRMIKWSTEANESTANQVFKHLKSGTAQNMMKIMGGAELADFRNQASLAPASTAPAAVQ